MARTHSILRAEAPRLIEPGLVLARANELLAPEMPARMFVTCLYGVLEPATGRFVFANAGHNLPYVRTERRRHRAAGDGPAARPDAGHHLRGDRGHRRPGRRDAAVLRRDGRAARARPRDVRLPAPARGDGDRRRRQRSSSTACSTSSTRSPAPGWEQEDDITLVTLRRAAGVAGTLVRPTRPEIELTRDDAVAEARRDVRAAPRLLDRGRHRQRAGRDAAAWPRSSRRWASSPRGSSASRPRSPRP